MPDIADATTTTGKPQGAGVYEPQDPRTWDLRACAGLVIGLDIGQFQDHSALVMGGVWPQANNAIGITEIKQWPVGTPLTAVLEEVATLARKSQARVVVDLSNNSSAAQLLAPQLGPRPADQLLATVITGAHTHAGAPTPMPITVNGRMTAIPRISLSKRELVETVGAELDGGTLRIAKTGDWDKLRDELGQLQREARQSGTVTYAAPAGKHDDLVLALTLCVFGCRRLGGARRDRGTAAPVRAPFSNAAWT